MKGYKGKWKEKQTGYIINTMNFNVFIDEQGKLERNMHLMSFLVLKKG